MNSDAKEDAMTLGGLETLREEERRFVEDLASLLLARGMPYSSGRVYGYLLLKQTPQSVDDLAQALDLSRVGAWNAARKLETFGHVQRHGVPGSKRALYSPSDNFASPFLGQLALLIDQVALLEDCARTTVRDEAAEKLKSRARFYRTICEVMERTLRELTEERLGEKAD